MVDVGVLVVLKELLHIDVLVSSAISFCVSVAVNYILSMAFVFKSKKQSKIKEFKELLTEEEFNKTHGYHIRIKQGSNPFADIEKRLQENKLNYQGSFTDIMLVKE